MATRQDKPKSRMRRVFVWLFVLAIVVPGMCAAVYSKVTYGYWFYPPPIDSRLIKAKSIDGLYGVSYQRGMQPVEFAGCDNCFDRTLLSGSPKDFWGGWQRVGHRLGEQKLLAAVMTPHNPPEGLLSSLVTSGEIKLGTRAPANWMIHGLVVHFTTQDEEKLVAVLIDDQLGTRNGWHYPCREITMRLSPAGWVVDHSIQYMVPIGARDEEWYFPVMWRGVSGFLIAVLFIVASFSWLIRKIGTRHKSGHCQACSYNLVGSPTTRCPECGTINQAT